MSHAGGWVKVLNLLALAASLSKTPNRWQVRKADTVHSSQLSQTTPSKSNRKRPLSDADDDDDDVIVMARAVRLENRVRDATRRVAVVARSAVGNPRTVTTATAAERATKVNVGRLAAMTNGRM